MNRLARVLAVRPGEGPGVALVAALFALIEAGRGFGEVGADTLLLNRVGAGALPYLYVGLGLITLVVALGFGAAVGRSRMGPFFIAVLGSFGAILTVLGIVAMAAGEGLIPVIWLVVYVVGLIEGTLVWSLAGSVFDARQAKRVFPLCTSAAILGGFIGTLGSGPLARTVGTELLVAADGVVLGVAALVTIRITRQFGRTLTARRRPMPIVTQLRSGYEYVRASPLMRLVAFSYVVFSVLAFAVTFPFMRAMAGAFPKEADLATALGLLSAGVTAASFVMSVGIANRVYARFGIATAALILPIVYLAGFATWLVAFTVTTAVIVRFAQQVTQRGLSNAAWSAFYNVVPRERRAQVLAFMDGVPGQLGIALSGLLLIAANTLLTPAQVPWIGFGAAVICVVLVLQVRRRYAESLVTTLRAGLAEQMLEGGPGLLALASDPQLIEELRAGLTEANPRVRSLSAELLGRLGRHDAVDGVVPLLADEVADVRAAAVTAIAELGGPAAVVERVRARLEDPEAAVRVSAVRAVARLDPTAITIHCDALAADPDPAVRAELAVALVESGAEDRPHQVLGLLLESASPADRAAGLKAVTRLGGHLPSPRLIESLSDPIPSVREAAVQAVAAVDEIGDRVPILVAALDDDARVVRLAAAHGLGRHFEEARDSVLQLLATGSGRAQESALVALEGHGAEVRSALLEWSTGQVRRAEMLRAYARSLDTSSSNEPDAAVPTPPARLAGAGSGATNGARNGASAAFLRDILRRREWQIEDRLLTAVAVAGAPEASGLLRRCLRSDDPETRAQAIEALDSLGDRALGGSLVRLLESDVNDGTTNEADALRELTLDSDPWVRALAVHALSARLAEEWHQTVAHARTDPDPIVRSTVIAIDQRGDPPMPQTRETLGDIERMLFLRRVPLFSELSPEDLQRIAMTAVERVYPAEEPIVREGDLGDELIVIVEGAVRVVRGEGAEQRVLRTYQAGDHIGELAVLRERPRAATVLADAPGVRGLVIGGEGLRAILRERPEAAMAMLATLAERISTA
jgi:HEAT repeat protein/ATP/ADP translocase